jgi:hypothetical protein
MKLSEAKSTYPGPKQVWRLTGTDGKYTRDVIALEDEAAPNHHSRPMGDWHPLLVPVMRGGRTIGEFGSENDAIRIDRQSRLARIDRARARAAGELQHLPDDLLALETESRYPVEFSRRLITERDDLRKQIAP